MMKRWYLRLNYLALAAASGGLFAFQGCGLSDQQWSSIWQSVLTTGLNTLVTTGLQSAAGG